MVIDGGSHSNMVSKKLVDELKLLVEEHPKPYRVGWIKGAEPVEINSRCHVSFSIDKYVDVVDMDAFHILLGRP